MFQEILQGGSGGGAILQFSTEEIEVGTWIDGKTIYRRTWFSNDCNYTSKFLISTEINNNNIETLIQGSGSIYDGNNWKPLNVSGYYNGEVAVYSQIQNDGVYMHISQSNVKKYVLTLDYTKA